MRIFLRASTAVDELKRSQSQTTFDFESVWSRLIAFEYSVWTQNAKYIRNAVSWVWVLLKIWNCNMQFCNVHHAILSIRSHKLFNNSDCTRTIVRWMKLYLRWSALSAHIRFRLRSASADLVPWTASKAAIGINWKLAHWSELPLSPSIKHANLIKLMITYFVCCWKFLSQSQRRIIN